MMQMQQRWPTKSRRAPQLEGEVQRSRLRALDCGLRQCNQDEFFSYNVCVDLGELALDLGQRHFGLNLLLRSITLAYWVGTWSRSKPLEKDMAIIKISGSLGQAF